MENKVEITYTQVGDFLLPNLTLPEYPPLGRWGLKRQAYLQKYRDLFYKTMLADGSLWDHLMEVDESATEMYKQLMADLAPKCGATEALKAKDPLKWVGLMNNCKAQAEEIILHDLIYA